MKIRADDDALMLYWGMCFVEGRTFFETMAIDILFKFAHIYTLIHENNNDVHVMMHGSLRMWLTHNDTLIYLRGTHSAKFSLHMVLYISMTN